MANLHASKDLEIKQEGGKIMTKPSIALALGGGGARGIAHIHIFEVLDELGIKPTAIAGTSIGAVMGAGYAAGMSGADIRDYTLKTFRHRQNLLAKLWKLRPDSLSVFLSEGGPRLGEINIERVMDIFLPPGLPDAFADLAIPFAVVATDYYGQQQATLTKGDLKAAVAASAAIPAIFRPVIIDGTVLIDGGMTNPTPHDILAGSADIVIAVDVVGGPEGEAGERPGKIDVLFGSSQLLMSTIATAKRQISPPDILIQPTVGQFRVMDFLKTEAILEASADIREELRLALSQRIDKLSGA
ncbi:MAG: patatin-like phospholipase family protein [Geminicoccaceae bacterium]